MAVVVIRAVLLSVQLLGPIGVSGPGAGACRIRMDPNPSLSLQALLWGRFLGR